MATVTFTTLALSAAPALAASRTVVPDVTPSGDTYTWTGQGSTTNWSDAGNWTCSGSGCVTGSTPITDSPSDVVFPASPPSGVYGPTLDQSAEVNTLMMDAHQYQIDGSAPLTVDGATHLDGSIFTQSNQTYDGPVTVEGNDVTDMVAVTSGLTTFNSTVDGSVSGGAALYLPTDAVFNAPVGASVPLGQLSDSGSEYPKTINTSAIDVTQVIFLSGQTTLGQDTTISAPQVRLGSVDGGFSLSVDGSPSFDGNVGSQTPLTQVTATGPATVPGNVTTTGSQTYEQGLGTGAAASTLTGSSVSVGGHFESEGGAVTVDAPLTIGTGGSGFTDLTVDGELNLSAGTLEMTGNLAVTGNVNAAGASLNLDGDGTQQLQASYATFGSVNIDGGSTLDLNGTSATVGDLSGGGNLADRGGTATFTAGPSDADSFGGSISGPISVVMDGTGSLDLLGALTWSGSTTVSSGTLTLGSDPAGPASIRDDGNLVFQLPGDSTYGGVISGTGAVTQDGTGTLTLNGANTYQGGTTVDDGVIRFFGPGNLGSGNITLDGGGLQWGTNNTTDISNRLNPIGPAGGTFDAGPNVVILNTPLTGTGPLTTSGSGPYGGFGLAGDNTYSGTTTAQSGVLEIWGAIAGALKVESGAYVGVSGSVDGPVSVNQGTLDCSNGTLDGGPVANNGGTLSGAPDAPTVVYATGGSSQATVSFTPGNANCSPLGRYTVTASPGGETATGTQSPITVTGLSDNTSYTFTVTETNPVGSTTSQPSKDVLTAPGAPTATISSPADGSQFTQGQTAPTSFSCADAAGGPGIATCMDSHGVTGDSGSLDTSALGLHVYTVTATSTDGQRGTTSISYTVVSAPSTPSPPPPTTTTTTPTTPTPAPAPQAPPSNKFRLAISGSGKPLINSCGIGRVKLTLPGPGTVKLLEKAAPNASVFGQATAVAAKAQTLRLTVKPNRRGKRLLKRHPHLSLTMRVSFTPSGGTTRVVTKHIRLRGICTAPR